MYYIETRLSEDAGWHRVIDTQKSRTKAVTRYFMSETEATAFAEKQLKLTKTELYRVVEQEDA